MKHTSLVKLNHIRYLVQLFENCFRPSAIPENNPNKLQIRKLKNYKKKNKRTNSIYTLHKKRQQKVIFAVCPCASDEIAL